MKAENERRELEAALLEKYVKGESNINNEKLSARLALLNSLFGEDKEKLSGSSIPLISKTEWIKGKKEKLDAKRPKEPLFYKVQDPVDVVMKYRQKFVEKIKEAQPQVLEDLRELAPNFEVLFSIKIKKNYIHILKDLLHKLIFHGEIYSDSEYLPINQSYVWGKLQNALHWTQKYYLFNKTDYKSENKEWTTAIIEENIHELQAIVRHIEFAFQHTGKTKEFTLLNFLILQNGIYKWVEKYGLRKDWLVEYAYYFIKQFSENEKIAVNDLKIEKRFFYSKTIYYDFEFKTHAWEASENGESAPVYKARVTKEFENQLNKYLYAATAHLGLNEMKKLTKPPTYQSVEWLVYSLVKKCDAERLVEKFYPDIAAEKTKNETSWKKFENKKKHIVNEINNIRIYGLPENKNL